MIVTKTKAAELAGVSRRTFYNHIPQKNISMTLDGDGNEGVELSELERVYGFETIAKNRHKLDEEDTVQEREVAQGAVQSDVKYKMMLLEEKLKNAEEGREQYEKFSTREREQLQDEISNLRESLKKAQDHHSQLSLMITHQQEEQDSKETAQEQKMKELEKTIQDMKRMNGSILKQLKEEKNKSFWAKLFG